MGCKSSASASASGRAKHKHRKGLWSPDEDLKLRNHIIKYGHGCWSSIPLNAGIQRNGKSCRLRWINYLRPGLKRGAFSLEEEQTILTLHRVLGNKWSQISHHLPGRTDNEIKNHWHSYLKKRVSKMAEQVQCKTSKFPGLEPSPSFFKPSPQDSSFGSLENMEASSADTDQSVQLTDHQEEDQKCNLPKVLFAEWLSLDKFNGQNQCDSKFTFDHGTASSEDYSVHGQHLNEDVFGNEMHTKSNLISVDDILIQSPLGFEDQISGNGLADYFPGELNIYCDDLYI